MATTTTETASMIANFPYPTIPKINGEPSYKTLQEMKNCLRENAVSVHTSLGGGNNGHLGAVVSNAIYAIIAPGTPYVAPVRPAEGGPLFANNAAAATIAHRMNLHNTHVKIHKDTLICKMR